MVVDKQVFLIQVTPTALRIVHETSLELIYQYKSTSSIIAAMVTTTTATTAISDVRNILQIVLASSGGKLTYFTLKLALVPTTMTYSGEIVHEQTVSLDQDVACLCIYSCPTTTNKNAGNSLLLGLGMWTDNTIRILSLPTLNEVSRVILGSDTHAQTQQSQAQARDILLTDLEGIHYLFVGLGDGTLIYFQLSFLYPNASSSMDTTEHSSINKDGEWVLNHRKKVVLGVRALSLTPFLNSANNTSCVFIACDRPTIIYSHHKKLLFSCVNMNQEIIHMTSFHSELFPHCLALSSDSGFSIGTIDDIQKLHIQTVPIGEGPRRIAYHSTTGTLAVCTEQTFPSTTNTGTGGGLKQAQALGNVLLNHIIFYNESTMLPFFTFDSDPMEHFLSCHTCYLGDSNTMNTSNDDNNNQVDVDDIAVEGMNTSYDQFSSNNNSSSSGQNTNPNMTAPQGHEYIVVGSAFAVPSEVEPSRGRILVFEILPSVDDSEEFHVSLVVEHEVKGAVLALNHTCGKLVASVGHRVSIVFI